MSPETGPSFSRHSSDDKGKRTRSESPSQGLTSKKPRNVEVPQKLSVWINSIKEEDRLLDLGNKFPRKASPQYLQVPVEPHSTARLPTIESAANHHDRTFDDLRNSRKFLRDSRNEAELAVYLGLQNKHDLRHFALSWPVLNTWIKAPHEQAASLKVEISHLIQNGKELSCIEDPYEIWPQRPRESVEHASLRTTHIMAWHLVQMSKNIEEYIMSDDLHNFHRTRRYRGELSATLKIDIPLDNISHPRPQFISCRNEPNDKFNRCWTILGYVSWIPYMKSWEKALGFFVSSVNKAMIYDSLMPTGGAIPRPNHLRLAQQCSSVFPEERPNNPSPIEVKVIWERNRNTQGNMNLCRILTDIAHEGRVLPPADQMMTQDPRSCRTGALFRDVIRHMVSCGGYGLNLYDITLSIEWRPIIAIIRLTPFEPSGRSFMEYSQTQLTCIL